MIQRIQSVFLLLCAAILGSNFAFPFATSTEKSQLYFEDGMFNIFDNTIILTIVSALIVLLLIILFLYNKRSLQLNLGYLGLLLIGGLTGYLGITLYRYSDISFGLGSLTPVIALVFLGLALSYIKKDEKLVKSMDRLR